MTDRKDKKAEQQATGSVQKEARRRALKSTLVGGAVISTSVVPEKWKKPVLDSVVLPSHAATTDDTGSGGPGVTTVPPTTVEPTTTECVPSEENYNCNAAFGFTFSDWIDEQIV